MKIFGFTRFCLNSGARNKILLLILILFAIAVYREIWISGGGNLQQLFTKNELFITQNYRPNETNGEEIFIPSFSEEILKLRQRLNLTNPGFMGAAVVFPENLPLDIKEMREKSIEKFRFNEFVSRLIPLYRELPDYRKESCLNQTYQIEKLPKVSVILSFYNEPFTMVMRTIYSILKRSPPELIEEIVLVDDASDDENLLKSLHELIPKLPKVRIVTSPIRLGLMKARVLGAQNAKADVLVVMDSHMEVTESWLPPLLEPIVEDPHTVTLPGVSPIDSETLRYEDVVWEKYQFVGGITWELMFYWTELPRPNDSHTPIPSPTMLGACFVIRKDYFEYLGYYDEEFQLWGAENLELSFKVWMCGGRMLHTFCSQVGHMYRDRPYWNAAADVSKLRNTDRLAEVWLDDYKRFYHRFTKFENRNFGDVSKQLALKQKLGCKSFQWFVDNVYPGLIKEIPDVLRDSTLVP